MSDKTERLEYLRGEIEAECISYDEIVELQSLADHIDKDDVVLLEWAGVPEHDTRLQYGFYSQEAANNKGNVAIWEDNNGNEVEVTFATNDITGNAYQWPDKRFVGEIKHCVKIKQLHPEFVKNFLNGDQI
jgi:hypothetical protein